MSPESPSHRGCNDMDEECMHIGELIFLICSLLGYGLDRRLRKPFRWRGLRMPAVAYLMHCSELGKSPTTHYRTGLMMYDREDGAFFVFFVFCASAWISRRTRLCHLREAVGALVGIMRSQEG